MMVIVCVCLVSLCEVNHNGDREKGDARVLPAFLQISSGRYPEGGLCKKSLWISETHKQAHTQSPSHTLTHSYRLLNCTSTRPRVSPIASKSICIGAIQTMRVAKSENKM